MAANYPLSAIRLYLFLGFVGFSSPGLERVSFHRPQLRSLRVVSSGFWIYLRSYNPCHGRLTLLGSVVGEENKAFVD